jgi:sugar phosphate isomerase/epimerase
MWSIGFAGAAPMSPMTAMGLLEAARELGVKVVQVGPNLPLDKLSAADLDAFIARAKEWEIELELGTRGLETDHLKQQLALAEKMGAKLLRTIAELGGQRPVFADSVAHLKAIVPELEKTGIRLGIENGKIPAREMEAFLKEAGSDRIGIVLDMVNSLAVPEGWREVTEILAPHTMCLHLKDFSIRREWHMMGFICEGAPSGKGQLDLPWLFEQLKRSKYDFNVIIELWPPEQKLLEDTIALEQAWAVESVKNMRQYLPD